LSVFSLGRLSRSKPAEFGKAMFDCNLFDGRRAAHQQRGVHLAESLAAQEGDRRHAKYADEGAVRRSAMYVELLAQFGNVDGPVAGIGWLSPTGESSAPGSVARKASSSSPLTRAAENLVEL
jgi:hypothetical protein